MRNLKKPLSILLSLVMILGMFTIVPFSVSAEEQGVLDPMAYVERVWDANEKKIVESNEKVQSGSNMGLEETTTTLNWSNRWYIVSRDLTIKNRITVSGNIKLILCNTCTLTLKKGIYVPKGSSLTIYGQEGDGGKLIVENPDGAAIGALDNKVGGSIIIKGGDIKAKGGKRDAGIGAGKDSSGFESIEIYGGIVNSTGGRSGAGIGKGQTNKDSDCGPITIYDGDIKAYAGSESAGIGGGEHSSGGAITIHGGTVYAQGGADTKEENGDISAWDAGAAIGGGDGRSGGTITINGGDITAIGQEEGAGIGGGDCGDSGTITINDGNILTGATDGGAAIGGGEDGNVDSITINGGFIKAIAYDAEDGGAGIGSGHDEDMDGPITINGGTVFAVAADGAAIGSGYDGDQDGRITITDGTVYARSGVKLALNKFDSLTPENILKLEVAYPSHPTGAGIGGGGCGNQSAEITISGGSILAIGSAYSNEGYGGAAIGAGSEPLSPYSDGGESEAPVTITGGTLELYAGDEADPIGHGQEGSDRGKITLPDTHSVYDFNKKEFAKAAKRVSFCHRLKHHIKIQPCEHQGEYFVLDEDTKTSQHTRRCKHCNYSLTEYHTDTDCDVCGYSGSSYKVEVNFGNSYKTYYVPFGGSFTLPEGTDRKLGNTTMLFQAWKFEDDESGELYDPGHTFEPTADVKLYGEYANGGSIITTTVENGKVYCDKSVAAAGDTVHVSATPNRACHLESVKVWWEENLISGAVEHEETLTPDADGEYTFVMPDWNVRVIGNFALDTHEHDGVTFNGFNSSSGGVLTKDTMLSTIQAGTTLNICLNGYRLKMPVGETYIGLTIPEGATLNIYDDTGLGTIGYPEGYERNQPPITVYGTLNLYGGNITGSTNTSTLFGGAVRVMDDGTFNMYGGSIYGNTSDEHGGGVRVEEGGSFNLCGDAEIYGNYCTAGGTETVENVYLVGGSKINVRTALSDSAEIGVTTSVTEGYPIAVSETLPEGCSIDCFSSDNEAYYVALDSSGKAALFNTGVTGWKHLQELIDSAKDGDTIKLDQDYTAEDDDVALVIPYVEETSITLDLNGHTIDRGLADGDPVADGHVITNNGHLTITDSSTDGTGTITGGNSTDYGGGIRDTGYEMVIKGGNIIGNHAKLGGGVYTLRGFTLNDGVIGNNTADLEGGGIFDAGSGAAALIINGGEIKNNTSGGDGGGISSDDLLYLNGGSVTGNTAVGNGGGIYNHYQDVRLGNVTITGNTAGQGGGVYNKSGEYLYVSGAPQITENKKTGGVKNNVYLVNGDKFYLSSGFSNDARIGVTTSSYTDTIITNTQSNTAPSTDAFIADSNNFKTIVSGSEIKLAYIRTITKNATNGTVTYSPNKAFPGDTVTLTLTPNEHYHFGSLSVTGKNNTAITVTNNTFVVPDNNYTKITVTAVFDIDTFNVTWKDENGTTLETDTDVEYGAAPSFDGKIPTKTDYRFVGWDDGDNTYAPNELPVVTADVTYTASFEKIVTYTKVEAKAATILTVGNQEYYKGSDNKLYTKDGDTYEETTEQAVTIPAFKDVIFNPTSTEDNNIQKFFDKDNMTYRSLDLLGVQLKEDTSKRDVRFITVVNSDILASNEVEDYGYIFTATSKSQTEARDNIHKLTLDNATHIYSCRDTYNTFTYEYGTTDFESTDYKYVTAAINDIPDNATIGARFYVKLKDDTVLYATYKPEEYTYDGCAVDFDELVSSLN